MRTAIDDPIKSEQEIAAMIRSRSEDEIAEIAYTANRIDLDQFDENPDYQGEDGWWDPTFTPWEIYPERESALIEAISGETIADMIEDGAIDEDLNPIDQLDRAIIETIGDRIGAIDSWDGWSAYASDADRDYRSGIEIHPAAHASYFPPSVDVGDQLLLLMPS